MSTLIFLLVLLLIDAYVWKPVSVVTKNWKTWARKSLKVFYWALPFLLILSWSLYQSIGDFQTARTVRYVMLSIFSVNYIPKVFVVLFLAVIDFIGFVRWMVRKLAVKAERKENLPGKPMSRSQFISKVAVISGTAPLALMGFGIVSGAHDYRIRRREVVLPNLPRSFDGITIAQLSDIHTGSFFNKTAVQGGVDMLLAEKPDVAFFTGDLVNNRTDEVNEYIDIFKKVQAPLGVYSVTGNHDYGDYSRWSSVKAKQKNFQDLVEAHRLMGYNLLMNENQPLTVDGESIGILGVENWGAGRFQKYGDLRKTYEGSEEYPVKILLSHDPSHWDAQVRPDFPDIDLMLAGHTHGFQFGIEVGDFKWSPSQYIYKQWADLYTEDNQFLYVNRGFGYLGYPGRIGITPEITILELKRG